MHTMDTLHILVLTDRDWTHPQGGGTGTNLFGHVSRWLAWGHRVSVIAAGYEGAEPVERIEDLTMYRTGGPPPRLPRPGWARSAGPAPPPGPVPGGLTGRRRLSP